MEVHVTISRERLRLAWFDVAVCAIERLLDGRGYEVTTLDMQRAHDCLRMAAARSGQSAWAQRELERLAARRPAEGSRLLRDSLVLAMRTTKLDFEERL